MENAIRPLALGRKNWLFWGNDASAHRAAIVYSLIGTCKSAGVDPRTWMEDALWLIPFYLQDGRDLAELLGQFVDKSGKSATNRILIRTNRS